MDRLADAAIAEAAVVGEHMGQDHAAADLEAVMAFEASIQGREGAGDAAPEDQVGIAHEAFDGCGDILDGRGRHIGAKRRVHVVAFFRVHDAAQPAFFQQPGLDRGVQIGPIGRDAFGGIVAAPKQRVAGLFLGAAGAG